MVYVPNTDKDRAEMLEFIGVSNIEELISNIPESLRLKNDLNIPPALSEYEAIKHLTELSKKNKSVSDNPCFIGGGAYDHIVPVIVDHVISRPEFYTAYTPYQAELSQGTLQVMYEFQTCVSMLAGLDLANASMYDGGSALAEAAIMAVSTARRKKLLVAPNIHPSYKEIIKTYLQGQDIEITELKEKNGVLDLDDLKDKLSDEIAAVLVQNPNFFGNLEDVEKINDLIKEHPKVQYIISFNPISVGLLKSPGDYGADIAVAEGQPLGIPLSFGGPYIGLFAAKESYVRKMPGRMSGKTVDKNGKEGYVLALQTREQHIKRERATSNICTNQGLMSVAALTYMTYVGKNGLVEVATQSYNKAHYLAEQIEKLDGYKLKYNQPFFNEFVVETTKNVSDILKKCDENNILGGLNLERFGYEGLLFATTEKRTKEEIDKFIDILKSV
jgi:glycine dehydrogenase subunit 1